MRLLLLVLLCVVLVKCEPLKTVRAAGATFPQDVYQSWASSYLSENPNVLVDYEPTGSTTGKKRIVNGTDVVFVGSDSSLSDEQYAEVPDLQMLPFLAGGIVAFSKSFEGLTFTREVLADVFLGEIEFWDDERIVELNPGKGLVHEPITIIYRSDGSGTTSAFTTALSKFSPEWEERYGTFSSWPEEIISDTSKFIGAEGNEGVFTLSTLTPFSISYVSFSFIENSLSNDFYIFLENQAGNVVECNPTTVTAATRGAEFDERFNTDITNSADPEAWPIATFTYIIIRRSSTNPEFCAEFARGMDFLSYGLRYFAPNLLIGTNGFAAVSEEIIERIGEIFETVTCDGQGGFHLYATLPLAPEPSTYYYESFSQFDTITSASYSSFFDSIGDTISASDADEYEPSTINSLYDSGIVTRNYYGFNDDSASSTLSPLTSFLFMIITFSGFVSSGLFKSNRVLCLSIIVIIGLSANVYAVDLRIGGFFPMTGTFSESGSSEESAARIAAQLLNEGYLADNDVDIVYQGFNTDSTPGQGIRALTTARREFELFGLIGCHDDLTSGSVALTSTLFFLPQISYASRGNFLSNGDEYPYFARVIPPFASEGTALALLIDQYGWQNVGVIFSADDYGVLNTQAFRNAIPEDNDVKITLTQFTPGTDSLDPQMSVLRNAVVRIIVMFPSNSEDAALIIHEASRYHMIGDNFVWFGGVFASTSEVFYDERSEETDQVVKGLAKGMIGLKLKGGYGEKYENFLDIWENLDPVQYSGAGRHYASLYVAYVVDALELFVRTFVERDFVTLEEFLLETHQVNFTGLTGPVRLNENDDRFGIFDIVNLRNTEEGDHGWVEVGTWFETERNSSNAGFDFNYKVQFHSGSTEVPDVEARPAVKYWSCEDKEFKTDETGKIRLDPPGPDAENIADFYQCDTFIDCKNFSDESYECNSTNYTIAFIIIGVITGLLILFSCALIPVIIVFGYIHKLMRVRSASPPFLMIIITSIIFGYASIYAWFGQPQSVACGFQPWLLGLAVSSMVAALCAKNIRIAIIFRNPLKRKKISDLQVFLIWLVLVIPAVFILFLWTLISTPTATLVERDGHEHYICETGGFTGPPGGYVFFGIFVAYVLILLLVGAVISFLTRKVPSLFNESKLIAISIYNLVILAVIIIPVYFVLQNFNPFVGWLIRSLAIIYGFSATLFLMFYPKVYGLVKEGLKDPSGMLTKSKTSGSLETATTGSFDVTTA